MLEAATVKQHIPFISSYCDRWCESCAFTSRCSAFDVHIAMGMCGDIHDAIELAIGTPHPAGDAPDRPVPAWIAEIDNSEMPAAELDEFTRQEEQRDQRIHDTSIAKVAEALSMLAYEWFQARYDDVSSGADVVLTEALAIARHDALFVAAKLHRALDGLDRHREGHEEDDDPVQNDWNGSAKVALISIDRSEAAWRTIAAATGDDTPREIADALRALHADVERMFPDVWKFIRPGFDEQPRA